MRAEKRARIPAHGADPSTALRTGPGPASNRSAVSSPHHAVNPVWAGVAAAVVAVVLYFPALHNAFIWDDPLVLRQLQAIHSVRDLFILPAIIPHFYFRPLIFLSYLIDRELGAGTPLAFHASVVAVHALNTFLVGVLASRLYPSNWLVAIGSAVLFAVFPTHVESVAWMAGRSDVIACAFVLGTVLLFMNGGERGRYLLGGLTFLLGLLAKETALTGLCLIPLLDWLRARRLHWRRYLPLVAASVAYFLLRRQALGQFGGGTVTGAGAPQLGSDLMRALGFYAVQAVMPWRLCAYIPQVPAGWDYAVIGCAVLLASGTYVAWQARRVHERHVWPPLFLLAWFFGTLAPSLTVILRRSASAPVADRYLYLPSVASGIFIAWCVVRVCESRRLNWRWSAACLGVIATAFAVQVVRYMPVWATDLAFWSDVAAKEPEDALPHRELASVLIERGRLQEAERELQRALAARSDRDGRAMTYNNLGNLYRRLARYDDAQQAFEAGLRITPHPTLYHNLGMTVMNQLEHAQPTDQAVLLREMTAARTAFEQALRLGHLPNATGAGFPEWDEAKTHALLGQVLFSLGDRAGAREHLEAALRLQPSGPVADVTRRYMQRLQP